MITILWQRRTPQSILGAPDPVFSADGEAVFITDGWGTAYAACRLRRLNLANGEEETTASLKDAAYSIALHRNESLVLAVLGRRVLELKAKSLERVREWNSGIPQYSHRAIHCGPDLLLMNWRGPTLTTLNLERTKTTRCRVGSCLSFIRLDDSGVLICSGKEGIVWRYAVGSGEPKELLKTKAFRAVAFIRTTQRLVLGEGEPFEISPDRVEHFTHFRSVSVFDLKSCELTSYSLAREFDFLAASQNSDCILLGNKNSVTASSIKEGEVVPLWSGNLPTGFKPATVSDDFRLMIGVKRFSRDPSELLLASLT